MKTTPARWLPGPGTQPEALIKEARRRQRRRYVAVGAAVVAVLGSAAGVAAGLHRHAGSPAAARRTIPAPAQIPASVGTTVLMWPVGSGRCCGPVAVDNLRTGQLAQSQQPAISAGDYQPLLTQAGRWLVYAGNGTMAIRDDLSGKPRVLGPTPFFAPSAEPGYVWLFRSRHGLQGPIRAAQGSPSIGRIPVRQDRMVSEGLVAALPGTRRAPLGPPGHQRRNTRLQHAMLPVHGHGRGTE
jgi:hypothetical protein